MIVHFTAHIESVKNDLEDLKIVLEIIKTEGHILARDWVSLEYFREMQSNDQGREPLDWKQIYHASIDAIERADAVIAEASSFGSLGVGYQVALALQKKKPVLLFRKHSLIPDQEAFSSGIDDLLVKVVDYKDTKELSAAVKEFLIENSTSQKDLRFNFVIDRQIHNHLRWKSFKTGKTKAEVVRDLLQQDIESGRD